MSTEEKVDRLLLAARWCAWLAPMIVIAIAASLNAVLVLGPLVLPLWMSAYGLALLSLALMLRAVQVRRRVGEVGSLSLQPRIMQVSVVLSATLVGLPVLLGLYLLFGSHFVALSSPDQQCRIVVREGVPFLSSSGAFYVVHAGMIGLQREDYYLGGGWSPFSSGMHTVRWSQGQAEVTIHITDGYEVTNTVYC